MSDAETDVLLRELLEQYGKMCAAPPGGRRRRGQNFNGFLARLLRAWGVEAHPDQRGIRNRDEIDVGFSMGRAYYILEAKWHKKPVNLDPVAKLYLRLKTRPPGVGAVLVSMSGYTSPVREFIEYHPEIVLLDRSHVEAMLCGLLDPEQLFHHLYSWASRRGGSYAALTDLLASPYPPAAERWERPGPQASYLPRTKPVLEGVRATPLLTAGLGTQWTGAVHDCDGDRLDTRQVAGLLDAFGAGRGR